jgi:hypothetical protein
MKQTSKPRAPEKLSPDEQAALEIGIRSEATGREYTLEESIEFARSRRKAWMTKAQPLSA